MYCTIPISYQLSPGSFRSHQFGWVAKVAFWFVFLFFSCTIYLRAQPSSLKRITYYDVKNQVIKEIYHIDAKNPHSKTGPYELFGTNGCVKTKGSYLQNKPNGIWERFYENGTIRSVLTYKNGELNGPGRAFFENGIHSQTGFYKANKEDSLWRFYFESGHIKSEGYYRNGKQDGLWRYFHEDSTLKAIAVLEDGKGHYKEYFANGMVRMEGVIQGGLSDSVWTYYHENGTVKAQGNEKGGERTGYWKFFYPNGEISSEGHFKENIKHGRWKYYHENGKLSSEGDLENESKDGVWKFFFPTGELMGQGNFVKGSGDYQEFYDNGKVKLKGKIVNNNYEGLWTFYFEDGGLEGECTYANGYGQYKGYYENGAIKMKGQMHNGQKVGSWDLIQRDGKLIGHYKTFYDLIQPKADGVRRPRNDSLVTKPRNFGRPDFMSVRRGSRHFTRRVNELRGFIVGGNPFALALSAFPFSIEYYYLDRLGFEVMFTMYRQPFFANHSEDIENKRVYTLGNSVDLRMKLYSADRGSGNLYVGQEIRCTNLNHTLYVLEPTDTNNVGRTFEGEETKIELSLLLGQRFFRYYNKHKTITLDLYAGIGAGYRFSNIPDEMLIYKRLKTNKLTVPVRLGFNFGYLF